MATIQETDSPMANFGIDPSMIQVIENGMIVVQPKDIKVPFGLVDGEKLYECPYNPSHQILYPKWVTHLQRCRKNGLTKFKGPEEDFPIKICPYDSNLHHVAADVLELHVEFCPSRPKMEKIISAFTELELQDVTAKENEDQVTDENAIPEDNSWETEAVADPAGSSDGWTYKPPSYRPPPLATKAEKKKYYAESKSREAAKLAEESGLLDQVSDIDDSSTDVFSDSDTDSHFTFAEDSDTD